MSVAWHWGVVIFFGLFALEVVQILRNINKKLERLIEINWEIRNK